MDFQEARRKLGLMSSAAYAPYLPRLLRGWPPGAGFQELEGTLVSVDLSGFTNLSERLQAKGRAGAEELVLAVSGVFEGLIGIGERHGGDVLKFRGDALLLFFSESGHEEAACVAATEMRWLVGKIGTISSSVGAVQLRMSTGVYTGTCHVFLVEGSTGSSSSPALRRPRRSPSKTLPSRARSSSASEQPLLSTGWVGEPRRCAPAADLRSSGRASTPRSRTASRSETSAVHPRPAACAAPPRAGGGGASACHRGVSQVLGPPGGARRGRDGGSARASRGARGRRRLTDGRARTHLARVRHRRRRREAVSRRGRASSTGADEDRMLRALRSIIDGVRRSGLGQASIAAPRSAATSARSRAHVRRHGRHGQSRRPTDGAGRAGRHPRDRRRPRSRAHALRDLAAAVPDEGQGTAGHRLPRRRAHSARRRRSRRSCCRSSAARPRWRPSTTAVDRVRVREQQFVELAGEPGIGEVPSRRRAADPRPRFHAAARRAVTSTRRRPNMPCFGRCCDRSPG